MKDTESLGRATTISPGIYTVNFGGSIGFDGWECRGITEGGFDGVIVTRDTFEG